MRKTKYDVFVGDTYITTINPTLIKRQNIDSDGLKLIKELHKIKYTVLKQMEETDDSDKLKELANNITDIECKLQKTWKFPVNTDYHRFWDVPKCECPKMDNEDSYPSGHYVINQKCPVHGVFHSSIESEIESDNNITELVLNAKNDVKTANIEELTKGASYLAKIADLVGKGDLTKINDLKKATNELRDILNQPTKPSCPECGCVDYDRTGSYQGEDELDTGDYLTCTNCGLEYEHQHNN